MISRRAFFAGACATTAGCAVPLVFAGPRATPSTPDKGLKSITLDATPISVAERHQRVAKLQSVMAQNKVQAVVAESGSTLEYFTGIRWPRSERTTAAVIPVHGEVLIVTPAFEEPSVRETLQVSGDVRVWNEHQSPFERIVQGLRDRGLESGILAVESTVRFFIVDGIRRVSNAYEIVSADPWVRACRMVKSPTELALMQLANQVTMTAMRSVYAHVQRDMRPIDISELMDHTTILLGATPEFSLVLLNESSAYPHGSTQSQTVHEGSIILMDCGCTVQGYQSDISRTWVFGRANARQRQVWNTVKRGQEIALETAKLGKPVGLIDDAVREYYEREGWGPGYKLPGLSHRTGHGIGLDGHEPAYLVHADSTALEVGMCFSDEPGIYIPGEFGIRLEDCWHMSSAGPTLFTEFATSIDRPV